MKAAPRRATRWSVAGVLVRREAKAAVRAAGGYVALSLAVSAAAWMLLIEMRALDGTGILVRAEIFGTPVAAAMLVLALFLAVWAAISAARDRENGTLEVLFYAPVEEFSYVLGKVGGLLLAYLAALPVLVACLLLISLVTGFLLTPIVLASIALSTVPAAEVISFGVLLSIGTNGVRSALLALIGIVVLLLGATLAYRMVLLFPIEDPASPMLPLRDALAAVNTVMAWISPFAYFERIVEGIATGAWRTALISLAAAMAYTIAMIGLAAHWLRRRGVVRSGE
jgi:ABC-type transport system involved in multi-copper enzyme maturation permease subunit